MAKKVDTTNGNISRLIFVYTIPIILSTILQSLFDIADKAVLGNMAGSNAVASIGATGTVTLLIINGAVGLSAGTTIILSRYVGLKNVEKIRETVDTALISSVFFGGIVAVASYFFSPYFLTMTNCPAECYDGALVYMRTYLAAAPATLLYNYGSAILRALGETQKPLIYITVAGVVNVVLNVILCLILPQKVLAVAIATVTSKVISAVLVFRRISHFDETLNFSLRDLRFYPEAFVKIIRFGIPTALTNLMYPVANLQIISAVNSFGVDAVAGSAGASSIHAIANAFAAGFGVATTTFLGQNIGAKKSDRVKKSFWYMLLYSVLISGALGVFLYLTGRFWLGVIIGTSSKIAIDYGVRRMFFVTLFTAVSAANNVLAHAFHAFGYPMFTSVSNVMFTLVFRVLWMRFIYPLSPTFDTLMLCFTASWSLNTVFYSLVFAFIFSRYLKKGICKKI